MRRLLRVFASILLCVIGLSAVFVLLIFAARAIGSTQPPPEAIQELHLTDCQLPCWLGITPGKTTINEALQRMRASHPKITDISSLDNSVDGIYQVGSVYASAIVNADTNGIVVQIDLITVDVQDLVVGDVVTYFGTPTCINNKAATAAYSSSTAVAVFGGDTIDHQRWRTPLNAIEIRTDWVTNTCP